MVSIHSRQPVIVPRERWCDWLDLDSDPTPLYQPGPPGTLQAEVAPPERVLI
jgi:putative SOS response-associated peptidase YedK